MDEEISISLVCHSLGSRLRLSLLVKVLLEFCLSGHAARDCQLGWRRDGSEGAILLLRLMVVLSGLGSRRTHPVGVEGAKIKFYHTSWRSRSRRWCCCRCSRLYHDLVLSPAIGRGKLHHQCRCRRQSRFSRVPVPLASSWGSGLRYRWCCLRGLLLSRNHAFSSATRGCKLRCHCCRHCFLRQSCRHVFPATY